MELIRESGLVPKGQGRFTGKPLGQSKSPCGDTKLPAERVRVVSDKLTFVRVRFPIHQSGNNSIEAFCFIQALCPREHINIVWVIELRVIRQNGNHGPLFLDDHRLIRLLPVWEIMHGIGHERASEPIKITISVESYSAFNVSVQWYPYAVGKFISKALQFSALGSCNGIWFHGDRRRRPGCGDPARSKARR